MSGSAGSGRPSVDRLVVGRLLEHGAAPHEFRNRAEPSYYLKVETEHGPRTFWSPALKRALEISSTQPQVGDAIGVKENSIEPVSVVARRRDPAGRIVEQRHYDAPRTHWVVEKREWFDEQLAAARRLRDPRAHPREAIRDHPELLGAYLTLDSAKKFAAGRFAEPRHQEKFLEAVREVLARATERGVPPALKVKEQGKAASQKAQAPADRKVEREGPAR